MTSSTPRIACPQSITLAVLLGTSSALAVKGEWHTDRDSALAAAQERKAPILAVAMDHG